MTAVALNSGVQALTTMPPSCTVNSHLLHTQSTWSSKPSAYLWMTTHLGLSTQLCARRLVSVSHHRLMGTEKSKTISQPGFFGVPQTRLLHSSIKVHFEDILLPPEPSLLWADLFLKLKDSAAFEACPRKV